MKFRNLLSILSLSLVTSIGAFYGLTKNNEIKPVKAEEVAKFCIRNGDELEMNYNDETFEWFILDLNLDAQQEFVIEYDGNTYGADCLMTMQVLMKQEHIISISIMMDQTLILDLKLTPL